MRKKVEHYVGEEVTQDVIDRVLEIIESRSVEQGNYACLSRNNTNTLDDLCSNLRAKVKQINIILGEDWFVTYLKRKHEVDICDWFSFEDSTDKVRQSIEMFNALKEILLIKNVKFFAYMKRDTSYRFFERLLNRGYVKVHARDSDVFDSIPVDLDEEIFHIESVLGLDLDDYFRLYNRAPLSDEYDKYFFHQAIFSVTDKFVKRYRRTNTKTGGKPGI